jgi:hypothetical protein
MTLLSYALACEPHRSDAGSRLLAGFSWGLCRRCGGVLDPTRSPGLRSPVLGASKVHSAGSGLTYGKPMAGESIDLGTVVSRYIEETRTGLERLFQAAENSGGVVLFDEADALFGKRSNLRSKDRVRRLAAVSAITAVAVLALLVLRRRCDSETPRHAGANEDPARLDAD